MSELAGRALAAYRMGSREQLTHFIPSAQAGALEEARGLLDPVQVALIRAHVTLCREHELTSLDDETIAARLQARARGPITLRFGAPVPFAVLICTENRPRVKIRCKSTMCDGGGSYHPPRYMDQGPL